VRKFVINSEGLGGATASDLAAPCVAFGYASYLTNPSCWGQSYDSWQTQFYGPNAVLSIATPAVPGVPSTLTSLPDTTGDAAQDLSNAALAVTQASNAASNPVTADSCQTLSNGWPYPFGDMDCPTMLMWGLGALAAIMIVPRLFK
jgi:hypothetical protein